MYGVHVENRGKSSAARRSPRQTFALAGLGPEPHAAGWQPRPDDERDDVPQRLTYNPMYHNRSHTQHI